MKLARMLQVALGLLGLFYVGLIYPLYADPAHSKWLLDTFSRRSTIFI